MDSISHLIRLQTKKGVTFFPTLWWQNPQAACFAVLQQKKWDFYEH